VSKSKNIKLSNKVNCCCLDLGWLITILGASPIVLIKIHRKQVYSLNLTTIY